MKGQGDVASPGGRLQSCTILLRLSVTYDHRTLKTRLPVRSALFKQRTGGLVVRWVTTSEYPLLYVFALFFARHLVIVSRLRDEFAVERFSELGIADAGLEVCLV